MKNMNETGKFDMMRDPECLNSIWRVVRGCLDEKIAELVKTGLTEIEAIGRLRGVPATGV